MTETPQINVTLLTEWKTGQAVPNGEPVMMLTFMGGARMNVMMPAQTAYELGVGLLEVAQKAAPPPGSKPS